MGAQFDCSCVGLSEPGGLRSPPGVGVTTELGDPHPHPAVHGAYLVGIV